MALGQNQVGFIFHLQRRFKSFILEGFSFCSYDDTCFLLLLTD